ncbi:MAG: hypothetical protein M3443_03995 [Actinomycetota bacterium]|nr:hypothetical protein [Actinomycetota bacterium]
MILAGTGLDSFTDPADITVLYPFAGWEWLLVVVGLVLLLGWHIIQMRDENKEYDEALELYEEVGMQRAMRFGGISYLDTDEDIDEVRAHAGEPHDEKEKPLS